MNRILVTGAAGFIGSHTCERLVSEGHYVVGVDDLNDYYPRPLKLGNITALRDHPRFEFKHADFRDDSLGGHLAECSAVVHLAARAGVRRSFREPDEYRATNVDGTARLLHAAIDHGVSRFVFASSSSVYGNGRLPAAETAIPQPVSPYAETKLEAEKLCTQAAQTGLSVMVLRLFTVFGPRQRPDQAIRKFTAAMFGGETIDLYGDGTSERDYTYVADVTAAISLALGCRRAGQGAEIINIGTGVGIRLADLVGLLASTAGLELESRRVAPARGDVVHTRADIGRAFAVLGWEPRVSLERGLSIFIDWFREIYGRPTPATG